MAVVYPEIIPGSKKNDKLRLLKQHPRTDHLKENPNIPTVVDRITYSYTLTRTLLNKCQPVRGTEPYKSLTSTSNTTKTQP